MRWHRLCLCLCAKHQEHLGRDELELFINPKLKRGMGEFRNLGLGKDVLPLLVGEIELLQPRECPHQAIEDITDTFLFTGDAHGLIRLQDPSGAASFI